MGLILAFHTITRATRKKITLSQPLKEILPTDRQEAAMSPMTAGRMPERAFLR